MLLCLCVSQVIQDFYIKTYKDRNGQEPSSATLNLLWATTVSIYCVGGMLGGLLGGWWADYFGRCVGGMLARTAGRLVG